MPYNSPYDDYLLAIDELTGVGWWATDRNRIPGKVTIYVFVPQELRRNVDPDNPDLISRARLTSIRDTWNPETDRAEIIERIIAVKNDVSNRQRQKSRFRDEASTPTTRISEPRRHAMPCTNMWRTLKR